MSLMQAHMLQGEGSPGWRLHELLLSPFLWTPSRVINFLGAAHNAIKGQPRDEDEREIQDFKIGLNENLKSVLFKRQDWRATVGQEHFSILSTRSKKGMKFDSVTDLLGVIRNKYEHSNEFSSDEKRRLGWFSDFSSRAVDPKLFVGYWTKLFPSLVPSLWVEFYKLCSYLPSLKEFYPSEIDSPLSAASLTSPEFATALVSALQFQLEDGGLVSRYLSTKFPTVEFRTLSTDLLASVLMNFTTVQIKISPDYVNITKQPDGNRDNSITYRTDTNSLSSDSKNMLIIIQNSRSDIYIQNYFLEDNRISKIVYLVDKGLEFEKLEKKLKIVDKKLLEKPVSWKDLGKRKQEELESDDKFQTYFQNVSIKLGIFFCENGEDENELKSLLKGESLNELLSTGTLTILKNQPQLPPISGLYVKRNVFYRGIVSLEILGEIPENDLFVVINGGNIRNVVSLGYNFREIDINKDRYDVNVRRDKILLLKGGLDDFHSLCQAMRTVHASKNIHCLRFLDNGDKLQWLATDGIFSTVEKIFTKYAQALNTRMSEDEFIESVTNGGAIENDKIIIVADCPGMGKSELLVSIATALQKKFRNKVTLLIPMNQFCSLLRRSNVENKLEMDDIIRSIVKVLCPDSNQFDEEIVRCWLRSSVNVKFEILFDGLDEINYELRSLAFAALEIIRKDFPSVRVWVTSRDYMLSHIQRELKCLGYKLEPFSESVQMKYLAKYWTEYSKVGETNSNEMDSDTLQKFARICVQHLVSISEEGRGIAGIPLQCRMIAEIMESKVLTKDFILDEDTDFTLIDLYEMSIKRKLEIFFERKKKKAIGNWESVLEFLTSSIERAHVYYSLKLLLSDSVVVRKLKHKLLPNLDIDPVLLEVGIIQNLNPLSFVHRTFAEFIVARYTHELIPESYPIHDRLAKRLLNEIFSVTPANFCFKYRGVCYFLNSLQAKVFEDKLGKMISNIVSNFSRSTTRFGFSKDFLFVWDKMSRFCAAFIESFKNIYTLFIKASPEDFLAVFVAGLITGNYQFCKYAIKNYKNFAPKNWNRIVNFSGALRYGILHWVFIGILYKCRLRVNENLKNSARFAELKSFVRFILEIDRSTLEQRDAQGQTPIFALIRNFFVVGCPVERYRCRVELDGECLQYEIISAAEWTLDSYLKYIGDRPQFTAQVPSIDFALPTEICHERIELRYIYSGRHFNMSSIIKWLVDEHKVNVLAVDKKGNTILHEAVFSVENFFDFEIVDLFYKNGGYLTRKNHKGDTAFHIARKRGLGMEFIRQFVNCAISLLEREANGEAVQDLAIKKGTPRLQRF